MNIKQIEEMVMYGKQEEFLSGLKKMGAKTRKRTVDLAANAVISRRVPILIPMLIKEGCDPNKYDLLRICVVEGNYNLADEVINLGADINQSQALVYLVNRYKYRDFFRFLQYGYNFDSEDGEFMIEDIIEHAGPNTIIHLIDHYSHLLTERQILDLKNRRLNDVFRTFYYPNDI
jgi:hypothetical protein